MTNILSTWNSVDRGERIKWWLWSEAGSVLNPRLPALFLLLLILSVTTACYGVRPVVKVGLVAPFEGRYRPVGYDAIYAARLKTREINEAGGIGRYRVELVALDDSSDAELARQAAASLVVDPDVVAVIGHWQAETTSAAEPIYVEGALPFMAVGEPPFTEVDPSTLPSAFLEAYAAMTPFEEEAGPYAAATYDAFSLVFKGLELAESKGEISRAGVAAALQGLQYDGLTGPVYWPE